MVQLVTEFFGIQTYCSGDLTKLEIAIENGKRVDTKTKKRECAEGFRAPGMGLLC